MYMYIHDSIIQSVQLSLQTSQVAIRSEPILVLSHEVTRSISTPSPIPSHPLHWMGHYST